MPPIQVEKFNTAREYEELMLWLNSVRQKSVSSWQEFMREYAKHDLYFLHTEVLDLGKAIHSTYGTPLYKHDLYVDACRQYEQQIALGGSSIEVSSRRRGKSEMRTTLIAIHLLLNHPDIAIQLYSFQKDSALRHIRRTEAELSRNKLLLYLFEDLLYKDPREDAQKDGKPWSAKDGYCIKGRKMNRSIQTLEAHAFYGGGPVGTGPDVILVDDVETPKNVASKEAIDELDMAYSEAVTLATPVVLREPLIIISNTRFSEKGLVERIYNRNKDLNPLRVREIPSEDITGILEDKPDHWFTGVGPMGGKCVYPATPEFLQSKWDEVPIKSEYALQFALSYTSFGNTVLDKRKVNYYDDDPRRLAQDMHVYVCIDPSRGVVDPAVIWVWGIPTDGRKVWLDAEMMRLDPSKPEFHNEVYRVATMWDNLSIRTVEIRVEDTVNTTWSELIERELRAKGCYIPIVKVKAKRRTNEPKFKSGKADRIYDRWAPMLNLGEVWFPRPQSMGGSGIMKLEKTGKYIDLVDHFILTELDRFPYSKHDDFLDAGAMICDEQANEDRPIQLPASKSAREAAGATYRRSNHLTSWMSG